MKFERSRTNNMVSGIIGGLSQNIGLNATILRILFLILLIFTGFFPMGLIYIVLTFVIPKEKY
ncbi:PspC domain-containing protein [Fictibacillus fluitans]|uniref:PspC domain-containing protein n=1 Tax=Fictibacillus fluitans TaxID=3058422 RepID=A0ABT8I009_9BACL|nr:PspC domain-containing protein [Fictibacillus sp. NE201]MDN4526368.1 PspC domain-containing protein [Fictibacillus sp. NE201]